MTLAPVNYTQHHDLRVAVPKNYPHAAVSNAVAVTTAEFAQASTCYPLFITKEANSGNFSVSAMLGLGENENLFYNSDGAWNTPYVPLNIVKTPFTPCVSQDGTVDVCIDDESPYLSHEQGEALFNSDGSYTSYLRKRIKMIQFIAEHEKNTHQFLDTLVQLNLIQTLQIVLSSSDGDTQTLTGLYAIHEENFHQLDQRQVFQLFQKRHLGAIYAMVNSFGQINRLVTKKNRISEKRITSINIRLSA